MLMDNERMLYSFVHARRLSSSLSDMSSDASGFSDFMPKSCTLHLLVGRAGEDLMPLASLLLGSLSDKISCLFLHFKHIFLCGSETVSHLFDLSDCVCLFSQPSLCLRLREYVGVLEAYVHVCKVSVDTPHFMSKQ